MNAVCEVLNWIFPVDGRVQWRIFVKGSNSPGFTEQGQSFDRLLAVNILS
jgi:hypothetical protein